MRSVRRKSAFEEDFQRWRSTPIGREVISFLTTASPQEKDDYWAIIRQRRRLTDPKFYPLESGI